MTSLAFHKHFEIRTRFGKGRNNIGNETSQAVKRLLLSRESTLVLGTKYLQLPVGFLDQSTGSKYW